MDGLPCAPRLPLGFADNTQHPLCACAVEKPSPFTEAAPGVQPFLADPTLSSQAAPPEM